MRILLLNPISEVARSSRTYIHSVTPLPPMGLAYLAAVLKRRGAEVAVEDQYASGLDGAGLIARIRKLSPDIIGISCLTTAMSVVRETVPALRKAGITATVVLGNIHPTLFPREMLAQKLADVVVRGEGEESFAELVDALEHKTPLERVRGISFLRGDEQVHTPDREPIGDLDSLPFPDWSAFTLSHYRRYPMLGIYDKTVLPVQGSRGCAFNCLFCSQDKFYRTPRYRSIPRIVDDIEHLHDTYGAEYVGFIDAYFPFTRDSGLEFCDEMVRRGLHRKLKWFTETRVDMVDGELMRRMKESGLYLVMYGFESGNQGVLDRTGKRTTLEQARNAMRATSRERVVSMGLFMLGLPGDTRETCLDTIRFAKELDPDIVKFNIATPFPGSRFFEEAALGDIDSRSDSFTSWQDWSSLSQGLLYSPENLTKKELLDLQRRGMFEFYMRPRVMLKHLVKGVFSPLDLVIGGSVLMKNFAKSLCAGERC